MKAGQLNYKSCVGKFSRGKANNVCKLDKLVPGYVGLLAP